MRLPDAAIFIRLWISLSITAVLVAALPPSVPSNGRMEQDKRPLMPSAQEIQERYIKALGGRAAIVGHKSCTKKGTFEIGGKTAALVFYIAPYRYLTRITAPNGVYDHGFDGETAWISDPKEGPKKEGDFILDSERRNGDLYYAVHMMDYFKSYEVVGVEDFEGRPCYHVLGVTRWGKQNEHFFDKETGLLAGYRYQSSSASGPVTTIEVFNDYKDFGGLRVPTREVVKEGGAQVIKTYTSVTFDDVDDSVFAFPANGLKDKI